MSTQEPVFRPKPPCTATDSPLNFLHSQGVYIHPNQPFVISLIFKTSNPPPHIGQSAMIVGLGDAFNSPDSGIPEETTENILKYGVMDEEEFLKQFLPYPETNVEVFIDPTQEKFLEYHGGCECTKCGCSDLGGCHCLWNNGCLAEKVKFGVEWMLQ